MRTLAGLLVAALAALLAWPTPGRAQHPGPEQCTVMLDQSLSMAGFYKAEGVPLVGLIDALAAPCGEAMVVGAGARFHSGRLSQLRPQRGFGNDTFLGEGLAVWLGQSSTNRLILVTDNVADSGRQAANDEQQRFYRHLGAPESGLTHISMLIVRLPFAGEVYALNSRASRKYSGRRALTVYVLERRGARDSAAFLARVEAAMRGLQFRRYEGGAPQPQHYALARLSPFQPGIDADTAGVIVQPQERGRNVSFSEGVIKVWRGASDAETRFALREVKVATGPNWDFGNAPYRAWIRFPPSREFGPELSGACTVDPARSQPGLNQRVTLSLFCTIPPANAKLSAADRDRLALKGRLVRQGGLFLAMETKGRDLSLRGPLQRHFGMSPEAASNPDGLASDSPEVQERVYRLEELLTSSIPSADRTVIIKRFKLDVEMGSSGFRLIGKWLLAALPYLVGLALLGILAWFATRPATYKVAGVPEVDRLQLTFGASRRLRAADGTAVALTLLGPALLATVGTSRRLTGRSGGAIRSQAGKTVVTLSPLSSAPARPSGARRGGPRRGPRR